MQFFIMRRYVDSLIQFGLNVVATVPPEKFNPLRDVDDGI